MKLPFSLFLIILFLHSASPVLGQQTGLFNSQTGRLASAKTLEAYQMAKVDVFEEEGYLKIHISSDFDQFSEERLEGKYQKAMMVTTISDSLESRIPIRIKPRGKSRRRLCDLPPIKLDLKKTTVIKESLQSIEKLKVVSPCKSGSVYENVLFKEFLVYKLFNVLTDKSFRVRLIELTLENTGENPWEQKQFGFIIEEGDAVGERLKMDYVNKFSLLPSMVNQEYYALLAMFEFMIGNPDWSLTGGQNLKTFRQGNEEPENTYSLPYDFDVASIVNAPYAVPPPVGQTEVSLRPFNGVCLEVDQLQQAFDYMSSNQEELFATVEEFPYLPKGQKKKMANYMKTFFNQLQKSNTWKRIEIPPCTF